MAMILNSGDAGAESAGAARIDYFGYAGCIRLENAHARVVLCPQAGARVLEYAWQGKNAIYLDPTQNGWRYVPGQTPVDPCGGRMDVGPERILAKHPDLWLGPWSAEITGPRSARLTSVKDTVTGLQLFRDFTLDASSSRLTCKQTMTNISTRPVETCHWSRTLAEGGGICLVPLTPNSRFPKSYLMYGPGPVMNFQPEDPNIRVRDGFLEILGTPERPKLGIDSMAGWFCYLLKSDLMFVKRYPVYPDRVYNEMAGLTISIWYFKNTMCELEPIGPRERLAPGQSAAFTEEWWLLPHRFPRDPRAVDLAEVSRTVEQQAR
jgi:hypothetical protein